ncbi:unnamed protein product, partial [Iphiclides podalirius]
MVRISASGHVGAAARESRRRRNYVANLSEPTPSPIQRGGVIGAASPSDMSREGGAGSEVLLRQRGAELGGGRGGVDLRDGG